MKLKINGKDLQFSIGLGFMGEFISESGQSFEDLIVLMVKNPFKYFPMGMFTSCKYAYELEDKEIDFNLKQFTKWLEADGGLTDKNESVKKWSDAFNLFIEGKFPIKEEESTEPKKK